MSIINCRVLLAAASIMVCATSTARAVPLYTFSTLVNFNGTNGDQPDGGLFADSQGNLYGATAYGGASTTSGFAGNGTVFELAAVTRAFSSSTVLNLSSFRSQRC